MTPSIACHFATLWANEPSELQHLAAATLDDVPFWIRQTESVNYLNRKKNVQVDQIQDVQNTSQTSIAVEMPTVSNFLPAKEFPSFDQNHYAQLLMRTVTGSVYPSYRIGWEEGFPQHPYDFEMRKHGKDWPSIGHTMTGWIRIEQLYNALRSVTIENVPGDFVELGVWRGGASIFAAGVIKQMKMQRNVWVCDSFEGFEGSPWDGDNAWSKLNPIVAVGIEEVRQNFDNYGLLDPNIIFLKGYFSQSLPSSSITSISILRMDSDLYSSTSDILYNLYERVSVMGFVIVDDWSIPQCKAAVTDFRAAHNITDPIIQIDETAMYWRKGSLITVNKSRYEELSGLKIETGPKHFETSSTSSQNIFSTKELLDASGEQRAVKLQDVQDDYFYLSKVSTTALGGFSGSMPDWVHGNDVLVGNNSHPNEDIRSHLPGIYIYTLMFAPKAIVELGVRTGWSTRAFSAAARVLGAKMLGVDKDPSSEQVYSNCDSPAKCYFMEADSATSATKFRDWAKEKDFPSSIDILFVDTTHVFEDTIQELNAWEPLLSERAAIILHDSNIEFQYVRKDGSVGEAWDNERGVARAIQQFVGVDFDESQFFDSGALPLNSGWRVIHDPTCCGLTILQRSFRPRKPVLLSTANSTINLELDEWIPPACSCDDEQCQCTRIKHDGLRQNHASKNNKSSCSRDEWEKQILPASSNILAGISHVSEDAVDSSDLSVTGFDFPIFVISNPDDMRRRKHTEFILGSAGFRNISFPYFLAADDFDIDELLGSGQLDALKLQSLKNTPWIGSKWKKAISLILNHIHCLETGISLSSALFGIFEDDLMLGSSSLDARKRIDSAISELPPSADVLYREYCFELCNMLDCHSTFHYIRRAVKPGCTAAMIFTKKGAQRTLPRIKSVFLGLDNMYAELIFNGELEAFLLAPPIFFQDGYFSHEFKFGARAIFLQSHRPFSVVCKEQDNDLDLTVVQISSQNQSHPHSIQDRIVLLSLDTFELLEWRSFPAWNESTLDYYSVSTEVSDDDGIFDNLIGSVQVSAKKSSVILNVENTSVCFKDATACRIAAVLSDTNGNVLDERIVQLKPRMFTNLFQSQQNENVEHPSSFIPFAQHVQGEGLGKLINVYVLNVPGDDYRWNRIVKVLEPLKNEINLIRWSTVPVDDKRITEYKPELKELWEKQVLSNQLSFKDAWSFFAGNGADEDWALFMEDDISFHPSINNNPDRLLAAIKTGFNLGSNDGFVYLGICNGQTHSLGWKEACCPNQDTVKFINISCEHLEMNGTVFQRGCGSCLHAYAMTRWRARTLYETVVPFPNQYGHPESIYLDFNLKMWNSPESELAETVPLWVIGSDLISPVNPTHFGICFQDWEDSSEGVQFSGIQYPVHEYEKRFLEMDLLSSA